MLMNLHIISEPINWLTTTGFARLLIIMAITWRWTDASKECLQYTIPNGTVLYLDNVWVRDHYLSCEIDGRQVTFVEANYQH